MPAVTMLGARWGDEGKGKATDQLGQNTDYTVRFNGGNNAGHTVVIDGEKYALHLLPAGILSEGATPIVDNGVVVDIEIISQEIDEMASRSVDCSRLKVSSNAHIIPNYNRLMDQANERVRGKNQIGATGRRIGPTYADKMNHTDIRIQDPFGPEGLAEKVETTLVPKNETFTAVDMRALNPGVVTEEFLAYVDRIRPMMCGMSLEVNRTPDRGGMVLFEGGQATMLDTDYGTYPFVASSNPIAGGALADVGAGPTHTNRVIGVAKAYMTRVGEGLFPVELGDEAGEILRIRGGEFGVTAGRACRTGWFDMVVVYYTTHTNGLTDICLTEFGVLSGCPLTPVCVAYETDGIHAGEMPLDQAGFVKAASVYEKLPGWDEDISGRRTFEESPANAQAYIACPEELSKHRTQPTGVGPSREATIIWYPLI